MSGHNAEQMLRILILIKAKCLDEEVAVTRVLGTLVVLRGLWSCPSVLLQTYFETRSHLAKCGFIFANIAKESLEIVIPLLPLLEFWNYRHVPSCLTFFWVFKIVCAHTCACMCACAGTCLIRSGAHRGQRRPLDSLEMELRTIYELPNMGTKELNLGPAEEQ